MANPWDVVNEQPATQMGRTPRPSNPWQVVNESPSDEEISQSIDQEREQKYARQPSWLRPLGRFADKAADTLSLGATRQAVGGIHRIEEGDTAKGVSDLVRATGTSIAPYGVGRAATGLLGTGLRLGGRAAAVEGGKLAGEVAAGAGAQYGVEEGLKSAGVGEGKASLAGDVAGLVPVGAAARSIRRMNRPASVGPKVTVTPPDPSVPPTEGAPQSSDPYANVLRRLTDLRKELTGEMNEKMDPRKRALLKEQQDLLLENIPIEDRRHLRLRAKRQAKIEEKGGLPEHALAAGKIPGEMTPEEFVKFRVERREMVKNWGKPRSLGDKVDLAWSKIKDNYISDWASVDEQLRNTQTGEGKVVPPRQDLQWHRQNVMRSVALANGEARKLGMDENFVPSIQKAMPNGLKEFSVYLEAKRVLANDAARKAGEKADLTGFEAWMPQYRQLVAEREKVWAPFEKVIRDVAEADLDYAVRAGLESPEDVAKIRSVKDYITFWRYQPVTEKQKAALDLTRRSASASIAGQSIYKETKGGVGEIEDPLYAFMERHYKLYEEGTKNITANKIAELSGLKGKPAYSDFFKAQEVPLGEIDPKKKDPSLIHFLDGGKHRVMRVDPVLGVAANNLSAIEMGSYLKWTQQIMRLQRDAFVGVSIPFAVAVNQARDSLALAALGKGQLKAMGLDIARVNPVTNPISMGKSTGAAMARRYSTTHQMLADRGVTGSRADIWRSQNKHLLTATEGDRLGKIQHTAEQTLRGIEDQLAFGEEGTRGMVWHETRKAAKGAGWADEEADKAADWAARTLTGDFLTGGPHSKAWGKFYHLFMTATIAGKRNIGRAFRDDPAGTTKRLLTFVGMPMAALTAYNLSSDKGQEVMADMYDSEKYDNLIMVTPWATKDPKTNRWHGILKIPLPPEFAALNSLISRPMEHWMSGQDPYMVKEEMHKTFNALSPLPAEWSTLVPQPVRPAVEAGANYSFFTGRPLTYQKDPSRQVDERTSETMRLLAPQFGFKGSPKLTEHLIRGYFGSMAEGGLAISDWALEQGGHQPRPGYVGPRGIHRQIAERWTSTPAGGRKQRMRERRERMGR